MIYGRSHAEHITLRVTEGMKGSTSAARRTHSPAHVFSTAPHFFLSSSLPLISTHGALSCMGKSLCEAASRLHCTVLHAQFWAKDSAWCSKKLAAWPSACLKLCSTSLLVLLASVDQHTHGASPVWSLLGRFSHITSYCIVLHSWFSAKAFLSFALQYAPSLPRQYLARHCTNKFELEAISVQLIVKMPCSQSAALTSLRPLEFSIFVIVLPGRGCCQQRRTFTAMQIPSFDMTLSISAVYCAIHQKRTHIRNLSSDITWRHLHTF